MANLEYDSGYVDNRFLSRAIRRRWRWIVAGTVLGLVFGTALFMLVPRTYISTSSVFLDPLVGNPYSPTTPPSRSEQLAALTTEAGIVLTDAVITTAVDQAGASGFNIEPVRPHTATEVPSNSQVIEISFTSEEPAAAQVGAQALADAFLAFRQDRAESVYAAQAESLEQQRVQIQALLDDVQDRMDKLPESATPDQIDLEQRVRLYAQQLAQIELEQTEAANRTVSGGTILNPASEPEESGGLNNVILGAAGLLAMVAAGILIALLREHSDHRIHEVDDVTRWGAPAPLGDLSASRRGDRAPFLRTLPSIEEPLSHRVPVLIGMKSPGDAASAAIGLAHAITLSGRMVCVVIASDSTIPGAPSSDGLSDLLTSDTGISGVPTSRTGKVTVIPPGSRASELPVLVQQESCDALVQQLADAFDVVLIATGWEEQVLAVRFARITGDALLVAQKHRTSGPELLGASATLHRLGVSVNGTVLSRRPKRRQRDHQASGEPTAQVSE